MAFKGPKMNDHPKGPFILTPKAEKAFEKLKRAFIAAPVLKYFNPELPIRVETDVSGYAIGGILRSLHEGRPSSGEKQIRGQTTKECGGKKQSTGTCKRLDGTVN